MMRRSLLFGLFLAVGLFLFERSAWTQGARTDAEAANAVDSIVLTIHPVYGVLDELIDTVITIRPEARTIHAQAVRQMDGAVEGEALLIPEREDLAALALALGQHGFFDMDDYLETGVMDGHFTWVTVNLQNGETTTVGGLVAEKYGPEGFVAICDAIDRTVQGSVEFPNWPADEHVPRENGREGAPLFVFRGAEAIAQRIAVDPPRRASVCLYTVAGGTPFFTEDEATAGRVADALAGMIVYEADGAGHTDDYLVYTLEWADETSFRVTFQGGMLLGDRMELYPVAGFDALILALPPVSQGR